MDTKRKEDVMIHSSMRKFIRDDFSSFLPFRQNIRAFFRRVNPTYHDHAQAYFCISGEYDHTVGENTYTCTPGDVVIIPPGIFNSIYVSRHGTEVVNLNFSADAYFDKNIEKYLNTICATHLFAFSKELGFSPPIYISLSQASFRLCCDALLPLFEKNVTLQRKYNCVEKIFSCPELRIPEQYRAHAKSVAEKCFLPVLHAVVYIGKNYPQKITSEELCKASSLCRTHLFSFFKRYLGISFAYYLIMMRISLAAQFVINTTYSITYISDKCGFADVSHMSKWYKKYRNELPREERARQPQILSQRRRLALTHDFWDEL